MGAKAKYLLVAAGLCVTAIVTLGYYFFMTRFSAAVGTQYVCIDTDDNIDSVLTKLRPVAKTHSLTGFATLIRHTSFARQPRTGRYAIGPEERTLQVVRKLSRGQQQAVRLTIPEARTMERLSATLGQRLMIDSAEIAAALTNEAYCEQWGHDTATIAALFVPDTYEVYWNTTLDRLMERLQREHDNFWTDQRRAKAEAVGLSPDEVATLASIIDEETANTAEKPTIAGMYLNRLNAGMPLQADPTVKFAMKNFALRRIYHDMLFYDSPYNTYRNTGLPPGPIKIASVSGIDAVLNHAHHDYLYMCAKEDFSGTHNFAATYAEHLVNASRYARALNKKGVR